MLQTTARSLTLGFGAGQGCSLTGKGEHTAFEMALGKEHQGQQAEDQHQHPGEQGRPIDRQRTHSHHLAAFG